jgi:hypothetical protein
MILSYTVWELKPKLEQPHIPPTESCLLDKRFSRELLLLNDSVSVKNIYS